MLKIKLHKLHWTTCDELHWTLCRKQIMEIKIKRNGHRGGQNLKNEYLQCKDLILIAWSPYAATFNTKEVQADAIQFLKEQSIVAHNQTELLGNWITESNWPCSSHANKTFTNHKSCLWSFQVLRLTWFGCVCAHYSQSLIKSRCLE